MVDDFVVRSGAKDLLTRAVAALLEVRPANPVVFLANHFDTSSSAVDRSVRALHLCPPQSSAFQDVAYQAFRWLSASSLSEASPIEPIGFSGSSVISRHVFEDVVKRLVDELPAQVRQRVFDALCGANGSPSDVRIAEFQRGVEICILLEELFDVVEELYYSVDKGGIGEVKQAVLLSALENAAQQSKQREIDDYALGFLRLHLQSRHDRPDLPTGGAPAADNATSSVVQKSVRLVDLHEIVYQAVFSP